MADGLPVEVRYSMDIVTYCDIYDCKDCPRYGDDCDGEFEEEEWDT